MSLNFSCTFCIFSSNLGVEERPLVWISTTDPILISLEWQFQNVLVSTEAWHPSWYFYDKSGSYLAVPISSPDNEPYSFRRITNFIHSIGLHIVKKWTNCTLQLTILACNKIKVLIWTCKLGWDLNQFCFPC